MVGGFRAGLGRCVGLCLPVAWGCGFLLLSWGVLPLCAVVLI